MTFNLVSTPEAVQNAFHARLNNFMNRGYIGFVGRAVSLFSLSLSTRMGARDISREFHRVRAALSKRPLEVQTRRHTVDIKPYIGECSCVYEVQSILRPFHNNLVAAFCHGSVATDEIIPYSDFDGALIIKDTVVASNSKLASLARGLIESRVKMNTFDPLQHHGWIVTTETDLDFYCEAYFPVSLFAEAKALIPAQGLGLCLQLRNSQSEFLAAFDNLSSVLLRRFEGGTEFKNSYEAKAVLSQLMLIPALFLQAKRLRSCSKAESFAIAKEYFDDEIWRIMDEVSAIRANWQLDDLNRISRVAARLRSWRPILLSRFAPRLAPETAQQISELRAVDILRLLREMRNVVGITNRGKCDINSRN